MRHFLGKRLPLLITVTDRRTYFNEKMNILHRHQMEAIKLEQSSGGTVRGGRSKTPTGSHERAGIRNQGVEAIGHIE